MDTDQKGKCHVAGDECTKEHCEDVSDPQEIYQLKSNKCSKNSQQISEQEDIDSNESQRQHGEEFQTADNQCAVCDKICDSQQILIIHAMDNHPNDKAFKCPDCGEAFSRISGLARHKKTHDDLLNCEICSKVFKSNYHLERHLSSHTKKSSYACPLCEKICKNQYLLQKHQTVHFKPESKHFCKFCSKSFDCLNNLKIHLRVVHNAERLRKKKPSSASSKNQGQKLHFKSDKEKKNICPFCSKSFLRKDILKRHLKVHTGERPYQCYICNKAYKDKRDLSHHQKIHLEQKSEFCDTNSSTSKAHAKSGKVESNNYKTKDVSMEFEDYILPHAPISSQDKEETNTDCSHTESKDGSNESKTKYIYEEARKPRAEKDDTIKSETDINKKQIGYECAVCDKMFKFERDFIIHVKKFHNNARAFKCSNCNARFTNASGLAAHERIHKYKKNRLICGFCSKSFSCISYLKFHLEVHSVGRSYTCSFCDKNYKYKRDLTKHEKTNHLRYAVNKNSYVCEFCNKAFDRPSILDRHLKVHNGERPFFCNNCEKSFKHKVNLKTHQNICLQSNSLNENPLEPETNITIKCEANEESSNIEEEQQVQFDLFKKPCQNNKFSPNNNEKESMNIKDNEIYFSDNESLNDGNERNMLEICITENTCGKVVLPAVEHTKDTSTKIQPKSITRRSNRLNKSTKKLHGAKRQIQTNNKCAVCNKIFIFQRDLIKHAQEHHQSRKPLKCRYCKERFSNIQTLLKHSRIHKEITKSHRCEFCLEHFSSVGDLKSHLSQHYEDVDDKLFHKKQKSNVKKNYKKNNNLKEKSNANGEVPKRNHICELCSKSFPTMYRLNLHLTSHTVRRPLSCSYCEKTFKSKSNLDYHEKIHKGIEKRYSCEICSKAFRSQSMVTRHMKYHTNERSYSCYQCKKTYKHNVDLKKHQKICLQSNSCSLCEKIFADNESLQTHLKVHYVNKCAVCNKLCNSQRDLVKHARQFHPRSKAFQCQTCSLVLSNKRALNMHKKICLQIKSCAYCTRIMADDDNFKRHLMMHYVNKCAVCEKVCKSQKDLIIHAHQFHPNGKAFKCPVCDKLYASKTPFNCHTKTHRKEIKGNFFMFLYEKKYKQNIDLGFLKLMENGSNITNLTKIKDQINENQDDLVNAEYLSDFEYTEQEVCHNDEENAEENMNSLDIEILYNNSPGDELIVKKELIVSDKEDIVDILPQAENFEDNSQQNVSKEELVIEEIPHVAVEYDLADNEYTDVEEIVLPVENLKYNYQQNESKQEHVIYESSPPVEIDLDLSNNEFIDVEDIVELVENLEDNYQQNELKQEQVIEESLTMAIDYDLCNNELIEVDDIVYPIENFGNNYQHNEPKQDQVIEESLPIDYDLSNNEYIEVDDIVYPIGNLENNYQQNRPKQEQIIEESNPPVAIDYDLANNEFIDVEDIEHPIENLENNYQQNAPKQKQVIEENPPVAIAFDLANNGFIIVESMVYPDKNLDENYEKNESIQTQAIEESPVAAIELELSKTEFIDVEATVPTLENLENNYEQIEPKQEQVIEQTPPVTIPVKLGCMFKPLGVKKKILTDKKCAVCHKIFKFQRDLIKHAEKYHRSANAFKCKNCSSQFSNKQAVSIHYKVNHTTNLTKKYTCKICSKSFIYEDDLNVHSRTHLPDPLAVKYPPAAIQIISTSQDDSKRTHICHICSKGFSNTYRLNRHLKAHTVERPYSCSLCGNNYKHEYTLREHEKTHLDFSKSKHACEICFRTFSCASRLNRHLVVHTKERPYSCSICQKSFKHLQNMKVHETKHLGLELVDRTHVCEICSKAFAAERHLKRHLGFHSGERPYACSMCEKVFKNKNGLNKHLPTHANDELNAQGKPEVSKKLRKPAVRKQRIPKSATNDDQQKPVMKRYTPSEYKCAVCEKMFNFVRDLIQHAKQYHRNAKAFKCAECDRRFFNTQALSSHIRTHTYATHNNKSYSEKENKNIYMCEFCSKSFNCMSLLHRHFKAHNVERPFSCSVCNKTYKHMNDLNMHKKSHVKTNTCEICFKTFARSDSLYRHLKLHDSNQCAICDMMCNSKLDLANHAKQYHPNGKVFKCQICGILFGSRISLQRHMTKHKDTSKVDHDYSYAVYEEKYKKNESNLGENDLQESKPDNIVNDVDAVATDDNQFVSTSNNYETNEEIIVVDDIDHTEELFANTEYYVEEITHSVNAQDIIENLFVRIVTP